MSNLPPGVTNAMIDAAFGPGPEIEDATRNPLSEGDKVYRADRHPDDREIGVVVEIEPAEVTYDEDGPGLIPAVVIVDWPSGERGHYACRDTPRGDRTDELVVAS